MEKVGIRDRLAVLSELTQGRELANELKEQLHPINTPSDTCSYLLEKIVSSYENALTMLALLGNGDPSQFVVNNMLQSPNLTQGSPISEGSDPDYKDRAHKHVSKKRKLSPKWTKQVRVCSGKGFDGQLDDGYNWRKYGQKAILGATNPRSYYRCTHRHTQGCLATKQVQQTDEDSLIINVIYQGNHNCIQERLKQKKLEKREEMTISNELPADIGLKVETQELGPKDEHGRLFSFPSTAISEQAGAHLLFSDHSNFGETSYVPQFSSPATPDESYFSMSPCQASGFGYPPDFHNVPESAFAEIISNPTPVMDFPSGDMDLLIDQVGFDAYFLDAFDYLS